MIRPRKMEIGDVTPIEAARLMSLSLEQFDVCKLSLIDRGFPPPDPTTGNYDIDAIQAWRRSRHPRLFPEAPRLTAVPKLRDARERLG